MSIERKVRIRHYSGRMKVITHSVLPKGSVFQCKSIATSTIRIRRISCDLDLRLNRATEAQVFPAKRYAARYSTKIVKIAACASIARLKVDTESIAIGIQDFRGTDLDKARHWWHRNKERVVALLPLTWQGVTYTVRFPGKFEEWLYDDKLNPAMREVYVFNRLRRFRRALHDFARS